MLKLDKNKKYLLACSYGPDSMALFDMLRKEGFNFVVAHVNYGVRPECKKETEDLNHYSALNDIEIEILYSKNRSFGANFEAKAREIRYKFFKKIYDQIHADALLVAHQMDDLLETYYLQEKRGGLVEYYGIQEETNIFGMNVIRPLLSYTKQDLFFYCQANKVPFAIDSSNNEMTFTRNIIRKTMVNTMNEREKHNVLKEIDRKNKDLLTVYEKLNSLDLHNKEILLSLNDEEFQRSLIILARTSVVDASISASLTKEIKKILLSNKPNVKFEINKELVFLKEYDWVGFALENEEYVFNYVIEKPSKLETKYFYLDFTNEYENRNVTLDDFPITIRNALPEDEIKVLSYTVKARRLFIDWKMPSSLRKRWPIIVNKSGVVLYIPRYRKEYKLKNDENFYVKIN